MNKMAQLTVEIPRVIKFASDANVQPQFVYYLARSARLPVLELIKRANADPADFVQFLRTLRGADKAAAVNPTGLAARMKTILGGFGKRMQSGMGKVLPKPMVSTPTRAAATAGAGLTAAGVAGTAAYQSMGKVPGAQQAVQAMGGKMETPLARQPSPTAAAASSQGAQPMGLMGRLGAASAQIRPTTALAAGIGAGAGVAAGYGAGRKAKKKQPGKVGKPAEKAAMDPLLATGIALPGVFGAVGAARGFKKAPRGRRLKAMGKGALRGVGGGLGALAGLGVGAIGGYAAGAGLEDAGHPHLADVTSRVSTLGGGLAGHQLGDKLMGKLIGDEEDEGVQFKYGMDLFDLGRLAAAT